jgi:hypothetical protein
VLRDAFVALTFTLMMGVMLGFFRNTVRCFDEVFLGVLFSHTHGDDSILVLSLSCNLMLGQQKQQHSSA